MLKIVHPRKRLDLNFWVLIRYFLFTFKRGGFSETLDKLNFLFQENERFIIPFLSVRSGFDALLFALSLPKGSEIMVSTISIKDMKTIIEAYDLVAIPVDIDANTLEPDLKDAQNKITHNTKAFLFAHIFGAISNLTSLANFCQKNKLLLIEDGAQIFSGREYIAHPKADITMISFGPLKTATTLAGAIMSLRNTHKNLLDKITKIESGRPKYKRLDYLKRVLKFSAQHYLSSPILFTAFVYSCHILKKDYDVIISKLTRSFPKEKLLEDIRQQINPTIVFAMAWRLSKYPIWKIEAREKNAMEKVAMFQGKYQIPGIRSLRHTCWLLPVTSSSPNEDIEKLRKNNIDATKLSTSLSCLSDNPQKETPKANLVMQNTYYIPNEYNENKTIKKIIRKTLANGEEKAKPIIQEEYSGLFRGYPSYYYKPKTKKDFIDIVQKLIKESRPFSISGNNKSHGGHTVLNGETHIDSLGLNNILKPDIKNHTIRLEAGVIWKEALRYLNKIGYSPLTMQSSNYFSIGGSIAGGIHGRNINAPHISDAILEVEYIDSKTGAVLTTKRGEKEFKNIVGGQGWGGIILSALIKIVPNTIFRAKVAKIKTEEIPDLVKKLCNGKKEVFFMSRPIITPNYSFKQSIIYIWEETGDGKTETGILDDRERNIMRDLIVFRVSLFSQTLIYLRNYAEYILGLLMNSKYFARNSLLCPPMTPLEFLKQRSKKKREHTQEFFIPISQFNTFNKALTKTVRKYKIRVAGITIRYLRKNEDISLSPNPKEDAISIMCYLQTPNTFGGLSRTSAFIREATDKAMRLNGRPFLSYAFWQDPKDIIAAYPEIKKIVEKSPLSSRFLIKLRSEI